LREIVELFRGFMLFVDPPLHTELRARVSAAFRPASVVRLRDFVIGRAHALLDRVQGDEVELIRDFALPLTESAIAELLGVPESRRAALQRGMRGIAPLFGGDARALATASRPARELRGLFARLLVGDAEPGGFLTGSARDSRRRGRHPARHGDRDLRLRRGLAPPCTDRERVGVAARPAAWDALAARAPSDLSGAVEELLRFDPPIHRSQRFALEELELGGRRIRRGALITPVLASANHDPAVFSDPDRLDFERDAREQLAFGGGIHTCLGAWMARFELELGLRALSSATRSGVDRRSSSGEKPQRAAWSPATARSGSTLLAQWRRRSARYASDGQQRRPLARERPSRRRCRACRSRPRRCRARRRPRPTPDCPPRTLACWKMPFLPARSSVQFAHTYAVRRVEVTARSERRDLPDVVADPEPVPRLSP
jgi:hypothetical protein